MNKNFILNNNCEIFYDDGSSEKVYANWIHNNKLDYWKGWKCNAGVTRIHVLDNFDVYDGTCYNCYLGNLDTEWNIKDQNICQKNRCSGCTDDLMLEKKIND